MAATTGASPKSQRAARQDPEQVALVTLNYESLYFNNLELLVTRYVQPLRKWEIADVEDLDAMFRNIDDMYRSAGLSDGISGLHSYTCSQCVLAIREKFGYAITKRHLKTLGSIANSGGGDRLQQLSQLFTNNLFIAYKLYASSYEDIERTIELCSQKYERFDAFLHVQQRTTHSSLDSLLHQPVLRICVYVDILRKLVSCAKLEKQSIALVTQLEEQHQNWSLLNETLEKARKKRENSEKLASIELSFPNEKLGLLHHEDDLDLMYGGNTSGASDTKRGAWANIARRAVQDLARAAGASAGEDASERFTRWFIKESNGCVGKDIKNRRRLFLFNDVLLVAKPRASNTYSLRQRFWLPETWISKIDDDDDGYSFFVGSPFCRRCRVSFPTPTLRSKWYITLQDTIAAARLAAGDLSPGASTVLVHPLGCGGDGVLEPPRGTDASGDNADVVVKRGLAGVCTVAVGVGVSTTAHDVIASTVSALSASKIRVPEYFQGPTDALQLYELGTVGVSPVSGAALPRALVSAGARCGLHASKCQFILAACDDAPLTLDLLPDAVSKLCVLATDTAAGGGKRTSRAMSAHSDSQKSAASGRTVSTGGVGRTTSTGGSAGDEKKKGGMFTKLSAGLSKRLHTVQASISKRLSGSESPAMRPYVPPSVGGDDDTAGNASGCLYKKSLEDLLAPTGMLPRPVQHMIARLYYDGPSAVGLFRKSANARVMRQIRERLDCGEEVDFLELPILAVGAILKEFLRSLPDSVMTQTLYQGLVATNTMPDDVKKIAKVKKLLSSLPSAHATMLRALIPMFVRISASDEENSMTAANLGICIGQSLMWPTTTEDILKNDVPPFIEFVIDHASEVMDGKDIVFEELVPQGDDAASEEHREPLEATSPSH